MKIISPLGNIYIDGVARGLQQVIEEHQHTAIFIIADENTANLCVPHLDPIIPPYTLITIPPGEANKNLETCQYIWTELIKNGADRNSLILNVGGGVVCDIGGFAASCYQRGILFGHIPTTVIAMADASIGGKTGVDYQGLKNYIGVIRVPSFVWIDHVFLSTLPTEEKISGLSEIVKHAIIGSKELWELLTTIKNVEDVPWVNVFEKNLPVKLNIVESDLSEKGVRKVLNFGHTIGHALESYFLSNSATIAHGRCVATGILVESKISNSLGLLNNEDFNAIVRLVDQLLDPVRISLPTFEELNRWMKMDKKKSNSVIGFSLPDRIGSCGWDIPVDEEIIADSFQWLT